MTEILTSAQMRAVEAEAIRRGEVSGLELMERAGQGAVEAILDLWPETFERGASPSRSPEYFKQGDMGSRAVVLCGPGNNGGDGFVVARVLAAMGWSVEVFLYGAASQLTGAARCTYEAWCQVGVVTPLRMATLQTAAACRSGSGRGVVVDALFGTGLSRPLAEDLADCLAFVRSHAVMSEMALVCLDVPSGYCSDSGRFLGEAVPGWSDRPCDMTVAFHRAKRGHYLSTLAQASSKLVVVDIGVPEDLAEAHGGAAREVTQLVERAHSGLEKGPRAAQHKFEHGHGIVVSGGAGRSGAARLAARGALRIGAGVVSILSPPEALAEIAAQISAIMVQPIVDAAELGARLAEPRVTAVCIGPGLGLGDDAADKVRMVLNSGVPAVLDADALTLIARDDTLRALVHGLCVMTPHHGEFARLFPGLAAQLAAPAMSGPAYSKVQACLDAAAQVGCCVLYKGADSVIATPDGVSAVHAACYERSAPWLATAGSGDVLAGFITGLMARGADPKSAAETAAWLHVACARAFGPGLIAEDLPEVLPKVLAEVISQP